MVPTHNPSKQGLKPRLLNRKDKIRYGPNPQSIKTRIETGFRTEVYNVKKRPNPQSIKTRIETLNGSPHDLEPVWVPTHNPSKQGLKLSKMFNIFASFPSPNPQSIKTRIETCKIFGIRIMTLSPNPQSIKTRIETEILFTKIADLGTMSQPTIHQNKD